jgi:hypothetical protein
MCVGDKDIQVPDCSSMCIAELKQKRRSQASAQEEQSHIYYGGAVKPVDIYGESSDSSEGGGSGSDSGKGTVIAGQTSPASRFYAAGMVSCLILLFKSSQVSNHQ